MLLIILMWNEYNRIVFCMENGSLKINFMNKKKTRACLRM